MERRHQVFISSTFTDLIAERAEVVQALLELDCFPAGMEMFPATNSGAWDLIKGVIDDSDYYCLIIGGRYGSVSDDGVSFTEREYDYAITAGKPLVAFLHGEPTKLTLDRCESSQTGRDRLDAFRKRVEKSHHCKYWSSPEDLGGKVSRAIVALRKQYPSDGWVPGSFALDERTRVELANLRAKVAELEAELSKRDVEYHPSTPQDVAGGSDLYECHMAYSTATESNKWTAIKIAWDTLLRYVGPALLSECTEEQLIEKIKLCFFHAIQSETGDESVIWSTVVVPHVVADQIKVQLRALGQMSPGSRRRAVADRKTYWKLTPLGEARLISVQAISKAKLAEIRTEQDDEAPVPE